ncbi:MAG: hypothetical protein K2X93_02725 [Candidatus Obscuribacterales bacterium]|nr:hypothetical protein [Candidatus Obscuribacterales bacterium]
MSNQQQPKQESEQIVKVLNALQNAANGMPQQNGRPSESLLPQARLRAFSAPKPEPPTPACEKKTCSSSLTTLLSRLKELIARLFHRKG